MLKIHKCEIKVCCNFRLLGGDFIGGCEMKGTFSHVWKKGMLYLKSPKKYNLILKGVK